MTYSVFIDGAAGTTGIEIADRLAKRSEFKIVRLDEAVRKDTAARRDALNSSDFVILCLPDEAAVEAVSLIENPATRVIDASSAHRVAPDWAYGFAEFQTGQREKIADASRVSNPGCYPTGFLGLVAPLVAKDLLPANWAFTVNAVSGYSGGGKALIERFANEADIGFRSYGLSMEHKHQPEMKVHADLSHEVIFAPAVVRAYRGMLVEVPLNLAAMERGVTSDALLETLTAHYADSPVVSVSGGNDMNELLMHEGAAGTDRLELFVFGNARQNQVRLIARLDNLGKGASGAAVQNLNIMAGLDETSGLRL